MDVGYMKIMKPLFWKQLFHCSWQRKQPGEQIAQLVCFLPPPKSVSTCSLEEKL